MKKIIIMAVCYCLISCGGIRSNPVKSYPYSNDLLITDKIYVKEIGNPLIEKTSGYQSKSILITKGSRIINSRSKIEPGDVYALKGDSEKYDFYYSITTGSTRGIAIPKDGSKPKYFYALSGTTSLTLETIKEDIEYKAQTTPDASKDYFKQEFIFSGRFGNEARFTYREYINGLARNSFSQDLQYDLSQDNVVGFKGLRIEVIKANNTSIEYKILKTFD
ncbi:hypothetical protein [Flavobacterium suzhouense]|uniref:Lipoprotein n=1 Tax=Flavobacterium suzhouense TaxID=1529638 RepID=A0ABW5NTA7_9FLAO